MKKDSLRELQSGVYLAADSVVQITKPEIESLIQSARNLTRGRARICAHRSNETPLHEMLIALSHETYIRPHLHPAKTESFHVIEGLCDIVLFEPDGAIRDVIQLGDYQSGLAFFYRLADPIYHTLLIRSPVFVIHETTNGPFVPGEALHAAWAPDESNPAAARAFMMELGERVETFLIIRRASE
jgi:cupin fold WbuC family metalloprotein